MYKNNAQIIYSPSDLIRFLESPFASWMERHHLECPDDPDARPDPVTEEQELVFRLGDEHEARYLARLASGGADVASIPKDGVDRAEAERLTREAMAAGHGVIYQARLAHGDFAGYADFLERVTPPGDGFRMRRRNGRNGSMNSWWPTFSRARSGAWPPLACAWSRPLPIFGIGRSMACCDGMAVGKRQGLRLWRAFRLRTRPIPSKVCRRKYSTGLSIRAGHRESLWTAHRNFGSDGPPGSYRRIWTGQPQLECNAARAGGQILPMTQNGESGELVGHKVGIDRRSHEMLELAATNGGTARETAKHG